MRYFNGKSDTGVVRSYVADIDQKVLEALEVRVSLTSDFSDGGNFDSKRHWLMFVNIVEWEYSVAQSTQIVPNISYYTTRLSQQ